jgi:hypothetical protein
MSVSWTTEQIMALAPDDTSAKAGKGLAAPAKWKSLNKNERAVWGLCQGSGSSPYQVQIDLSEPAFRCSCPSRKFPCKHGLGLFLILVNNPNAVKEGEPPAWVTEWLSKREEKAQKQAQPKPVEKTEEQQAKVAADQAKRAARREQSVAEGLNNLEMWLCDLMRQGIASLPSRPYKFWDDMAARLVDAQAPGVARMLREMAGIASTGEGWTERLMTRLGLLHLLIEGYRRIGSQSEETQADIRAAIGWTVSQERLLESPGVTDFWITLGQRVYDEDQFKVQRTWLWGKHSRRAALILNFTRPGQPLDMTLPPGVGFEADMVYFPGSYPQRALLKARRSHTHNITAIPGYANLEEALSAASEGLACNPWLGTIPMPVENILPDLQGDRWYARDRDGKRLPLSSLFTQGWRLMAISGGNPLTLFGEWDGENYLPLSAWAESRYIRF